MGPLGEIRRFRGARSRTAMDPTLIEFSSGAATRAENIEFRNGQVLTRRPFRFWRSNQRTLANRPLQLFEWIGANFHRLFYMTPNSIVVRDVPTDTERTAMSISGSAICHAITGSRVVLSDWARQANEVGQPYGVSRPRIVQADTSVTSLTNDEMWPAAPTGITWDGLVGTSVGGGNEEVVTPGYHYAAAVFITRTGYQTRPVPLGAWQAPVRTLANTIQMTLPVALDPQFTTVMFAITPVAVPSTYYLIPVTFSANPGGVISYSFADDDATLQGQYEELTAANADYVWGDPYEIRPHALGLIGDRVLYHITVPTGGITGQVDGALVISDPSAPQRLSITRSMLQLPNKAITTGDLSLDGMTYVTTLNQVWAYNPTQDDPVTWPPPTQVSGDIGAPFSTAVWSDVTRRYGLIANPGGAWILANGQVLARPLSYYADKDWGRINWNAPGRAFGWLAHFEGLRVGFAAPLDGATESTHVFWWAYGEQGSAADYVITADNTDYSLMPWPDFRGDYGTSAVGAFALLRNADGSKDVACIPGLNWTTLNFPIMQQAANPWPWTDEGDYKIASAWESGYMRLRAGGSVVVNQLRTNLEIPESESQGGVPTSEVDVFVQGRFNGLPPEIVTVQLFPRMQVAQEVPTLVEDEALNIVLQGRGPWRMTYIQPIGNPRTQRRVK